MTEKTTPNRTYKKFAVQCSADTFVVNQTLVLRINPDSYRDGENRQLLVAANVMVRYKVNQSTKTNLKIFA